MFLHLGNGIAVRTKDIIAIHDYAIFAKETGRDFLNREQAAGRLENILPAEMRSNDGARKSLIITDEKTYLSAISPWTLLRRSQMIFDTMDSEKDLSELVADEAEL